MPHALAENCTSRRALYEIIWSCLVTTFACTWIALHPDVPRPDTGSGSAPSRWAILKGRLKLTIGAVVAPEFMVLWAIGERLLAKRITKEYNRLCDTNNSKSMNTPKWTLTHGFFLLMNGFMLYDEQGQSICPLTPSLLFRALETKELDRWVPLTTSKEEIEDKSKGDFFTKSVVVAQTTWFIAGCIGRIASGLPLVELEIMTLAFATMNIVTFTMWWIKPQNVNLSIPVALTYPEATTLSSLRVAAMPNTNEHPSEQEYHRMVTIIGPYFLVKLRSSRCRLHAKKEWQAPRVEPFLQTFGLPFSCANSTIAKLMPCHALSFRLTPILVATVFASFHFSSWSTNFPSAVETFLWRSSSVACFVVPLTSWSFLRLLHDNKSNKVNLGLLPQGPESRFGNLRKLVRQYSLLSFPVYFFARLILFVVAVSSLRSPPDGAFLDLRWSRYIPHFR